MRDAPPWFDDYVNGNNRQMQLDVAVGSQMDMSAPSDATIIASKMPHSVPSQAFDGNTVPTQYALYSTGGWATMPSSTVITPDGSSTSQAGIISDAISDGNADIEWNMRIAFSREHRSGLTLYFQPDMIAEDFDIVVDDAVVQTDGGGTGPPQPQTGLQWTVNGGVLTVTSANPTEFLVIPDYAEGGAPWYAQRDSITALYITPLIRGIGMNAFYGLDKLTDVQSLGTSIYISSGAFKGCSALPAITIPADVGEIFGTAFDRCVSLQTIVIQGSPQVYNGAFSLGHYDDLAECAISGIPMNNAMGNRYTKLYSGTVLPTATGYEVYDNCFRIYGAGTVTFPIASSTTNWKVEELLIFDRVTQVGSSAISATFNSMWSQYCTVGSVFLGDALVNVWINIGNSSIQSLRNGLSTARYYHQYSFQNAINMKGGVKVSNVGRFNSPSGAAAFDNSGVDKVVFELTIAMDTNVANGVESSFGTCPNIESLTGTNCEDGVFYYDYRAYLYVKKSEQLKFKESTQGIGAVGSTIVHSPIEVDTLDLPSTINVKLTLLKGIADTTICRCSRLYLPNAGVTVAANVLLKTRRLYLMKAEAGVGAGTTNTTHPYDDTLEILDIVGGTSATDRIYDYEFTQCVNLTQIRIRSAINQAYCIMRIKNTTPAKTYNVYSVSGVPTAGSSPFTTYTLFVRAGDPPDREVA